MAELSKIRKNGVDYDIKDAVARKAIENLEIPEGGTVTDEQIASAVEEYMEENPIEVVTAEQVEQAVDKYLETHPVSGLTSTEKNLILSLLRKAVYTDNMSATIAQLENLWAGSGGEEPDIPDVPEEPDVPVVTTYTITNELVNVSISNSASSVNEGASYTATLTAFDGYEISNVVVTMGGVDVTSSIYANGVITISSVTGNVEIIASAVVVQVEAVLPEDGLVGFFDFRNINEEDAKKSNAVGTAYGIPTATKGNASLYTWGEWFVSTDDYGTEVKRGLELGQNQGNKVNAIEYGTEYTFVGFTYKGYANCGIGAAGNGWTVQPGYTKTDGTTGSAPKTNATGVLSGNDGYLAAIVRANGEVLDLFTDTTKVYTFNGSDYEDFAKWNGGRGAAVSPYNNSGKMVAYAYYNKALSEVEIAEAVAYMKTLEVSA